MARPSRAGGGAAVPLPWATAGVSATIAPAGRSGAAPLLRSLPCPTAEAPARGEIRKLRRIGTPSTCGPVTAGVATPDNATTAPAGTGLSGAEKVASITAPARSPGGSTTAWNVGEPGVMKAGAAPSGGPVTELDGVTTVSKDKERVPAATRTSIPA